MAVEQLISNHVKNSMVVHINELLDHQHRQTVEMLVEQVSGVSDARFNKTRHHLMIVDYDPRRVNSRAILTRVKRQDLHAQIV